MNRDQKKRTAAIHKELLLVQKQEQNWHAPPSEQSLLDGIYSPRDNLLNPPAAHRIPPFKAYTFPFYYSFTKKIGRDFRNFFRENGWG